MPENKLRKGDNVMKLYTETDARVAEIERKMDFLLSDMDVLNKTQFDILNSNIFYFLWDTVFTHKWDKAHKQFEVCYEEANVLLEELHQINVKRRLING